jgi:alkylated DNA nucleotide flippase Atl1
MSRSWKEKLNKKDLPKIVEIPEKMRKRLGEGKMVVPSPLEVYEIMKDVPEGKLITINMIREKLARRHGVNTACPITTGIFVWIVANASTEGVYTPYWRTLKEGGVINEKYPGGVEEVRKLLEKEGFEVTRRGRRYVVKDFEKYLVGD